MRASKRRLAIAILGGCLLVAAPGYFLYRAKDLSPGYVRLHAFLDDAAGLMDGTQVRLNGIPIGYLDGQSHTDSRDPNRKVEFELKVMERYLREIPVDSKVGLASDNLLGQQYIGIRRGRSTQHVQPGAELSASLNEDITRTMAQISQQLDRLQAVATRAGKMMSGVDKGKGAIGKIVKDANLKTGAGVSGELNQLMADVQHGHGTVTKLFYDDPLDKQLQSPMKLLDQIMAETEGTAATLQELKDGLDRATGEFHTLEGDFKAGKGSLAKLDQLQTRFSDLTARMNGVMDKINRGQGTAGQMMVNPQLNEALAGTTREFQELAKGLKANPRKFVALRVF